MPSVIRSRRDLHLCWDLPRRGTTPNTRRCGRLGLRRIEPRGQMGRRMRVRRRRTRPPDRTPSLPPVLRPKALVHGGYLISILVFERHLLPTRPRRVESYVPRDARALVAIPRLRRPGSDGGAHARGASVALLLVVFLELVRGVGGGRRDVGCRVAESAIPDLWREGARDSQGRRDFRGVGDAPILW